MIIIKKLLVYGKYIGLFILIELFISFILGLFNLIGVSSYITSLISFVINISLFFTLSFIKGKHTNKKGIICGLINGLILILTLFSCFVYAYFQIVVEKPQFRQKFWHSSVISADNTRISLTK